MRLQYGRAPALLRGPIWQSSWREAALTWASLAQTCLATSLPAQEGAGCARLGQATGAFWPQLPSCLAFAPRPQASLGRAWGQWLAHYQELQQGELRQSEEKDKCRAPPAVAWLPSLRAAWRAVGSQGTLLGSAATHTRRLTPWAPSSCLTHVGSLALSSEQRRVQVAGACPYVSGLMPRAPAQGSSP